jgi:hypothetical protein
MAHKLQAFFEGLVRTVTPLTLHVTYEHNKNTWDRAYVCHVTAVGPEGVDLLVRQVHVYPRGGHFGTHKVGYMDRVEDMLELMVRQADEEFFKRHADTVKVDGVKVG